MMRCQRLQRADCIVNFQKIAVGETFSIDICRDDEIPKTASVKFGEKMMSVPAHTGNGEE